jgi:hypothetical protein
MILSLPNLSLFLPNKNLNCSYRVFPTLTLKIGKLIQRNSPIEDIVNCSYSNYDASSPQTQWFWRAVRSFDKEERAKLLQFATGTSKVPLNGFKELEGMQGMKFLLIVLIKQEPQSLLLSEISVTKIDSHRVIPVLIRLTCPNTSHMSSCDRPY